MNQQQALYLLKLGKNVFLTGAAGSGKTYLLNQFIQYLKENRVHAAVTASTGIAATHLNGMTLHSWSGIGVRDELSDKDIEKLLSKKHIKSNYKKTKVLIIDEISMLHPHQLDLVDRVARIALNSEHPFGGIQVVTCGDFFQLPPIATDAFTREKSFAFDASSWKNAQFHVCYLEEQHRQQDDPLLTILNDIRNGTAGEHTKVPLRTRYKKEPEGSVKPTKLYSRNINVDAINDHELAQLTTKEKLFPMRSKGAQGLVEGLKRTCLAHPHLKLKIGAEVMFIKNDPLGRYVNGTRGVVVGFDRSEDGWPMVKTIDGRIIIASMEEWKYEDHAGFVHAVIAQVPLRLAWAITIHKSQGMTLDAAEMDLGDAFEPGMGYVCLSRVRKLSGLKLMNLNEMALKVHPRILEKDPIFKAESHTSLQTLSQFSEEEIKKQIESILAERQSTSRKRAAKTKEKKPKKTATHIETLALLKEKMRIETIALERNLSVGTIMTHVEKLLGLQLIDTEALSYLKDDIPEADLNCIMDELARSETGWLTPIYEKYKGKYSYQLIRMVRWFCV